MASLSDLTRLQIVTEVANILGRDLTGLARDEVTTFKSRLNEAFEAAQLRLARAYSWPELDVYDKTSGDTIVNQIIYGFGSLFGSTRIKQILSLIIEDGLNSVKLTYKTPFWINKYYPDPDSSSAQKPIYYTTIGENVHIVPKPDAVYDITSVVSAWPTRLSVDASLNDFRKKDDIIIALTVVEGYRKLEEFAAMEAWDKIARLKIAEAVKPLLSLDDFEPEGRAFMSDVILPSQYWNNPFIDRV